MRTTVDYYRPHCSTEDLMFYSPNAKWHDDDADGDDDDDDFESVTECEFSGMFEQQ